MNRWKKNITALLAGASVLAMGSTAWAQEGAPDIVSLFYTFSGDNLAFDYWTEDYLYAAGRLQDSTYDGFLSLKQADMNLDGEEELIAIRIKEGTDDAGNAENVLLGEVYQYQGNKLQRLAQYELADDVLSANAVRTDVFLVDSGSGILLCCEAKETTSLFADGTYWSFRAASFDGTQFTEVSNGSLRGSSFSEEEQAPAWNSVNAIGLYPAEIVYTAIADQVGNLERLNSIERMTTADYDTVSQFQTESGDATMQYGQTHFYSFVNTGLENKFSGQFETETQAQTVQTVDYVIADSDSRFITEEDLSQLTEYEVLLARNEIYARHGRIFNNEDLDAYFRNKSWYQPTVAGADFTEEYAAQVFNEFEITNITTIVQYERAHGLNQF